MSFIRVWISLDYSSQLFSQPIASQSRPPTHRSDRIRLVSHRQVGIPRNLGIEVVLDGLEADLNALLSPVPDVRFLEFLGETVPRVLADQVVSQLLDGGGLLVCAQEVVPEGVQVVLPSAQCPRIRDVNFVPPSVALRQSLREPRHGVERLEDVARLVEDPR